MPGYEKSKPFVPMAGKSLAALSCVADVWGGAAASDAGERGISAGGASPAESRAAAARANGPAVASSVVDAASKPTPFVCVTATGTGIFARFFL